MRKISLIVPAASLPWLGAAGIVVALSLAMSGWIPALTRGVDRLDPGEVEVEVVLTTDVRSGPFGEWAGAVRDDVRLFLELREPAYALAGDRLRVVGAVRADEIAINGRPHQLVTVASYEVAASGPSLYRHLGNALRSRVQRLLANSDEARGLLAGFLVGDVSGVSDATQDAMKLAGLSHFVAVSGSNVAMYLGLIFLAAAPLGIGVRRRALIGLLLLPVFMVATRFEPSVVRASVMAAIVLSSRLFDVGLEFFQVFSVAVIGLLLYDPWLVRSIGFQLSVAATAGVVVGTRWPGVTAGIRRALAITVGAQLAVAPILLAQFGSIPLLSPISNLLAAPIVSLATLMAVPGVVGFTPAFTVASGLSAIVVQLSHMAAGWPQIGWVGLLVATGIIGSGFWLWRRSAEYVVVLFALLALVLMFGSGRPPGPGTVTVLDVGQGDAILLVGGAGRYALVDGGPDPALLLRRLRAYGIRHLDLLVITHGDADHVAGLSGLFGRVAIGGVWALTDPHRTPASDHFFDLASQYGVSVQPPPVGSEVSFGELSLKVIGPTRRYQSPNDQSIVILASGRSRSILLTGDIEVVAQRELPRLDYDILKVPHHGGGTSDPGWIAGTGADLALISVGENGFGHPVPWLVAALEASGARVERTDESGSIVIDLNR